jgi:hypothetical protein
MHEMDEAPSREWLPRAFDLKRAKAFGFGVRQFLLEDGVDPAAARAFVHCLVKLVEVRLFAGHDHLDVTVFGVPHPSAKVESRRFAMDKPAKANALYAALDEIVVNHGSKSSVAEEGRGCKFAALVRVVKDVSRVR